MLVVNGQYPGPTIVADWGDDLEITVTNSLQNNGSGIHWHGFRQLGTNEADGVNGLTECPVAPGDTTVYRFKATQYGTTYGDGLVGTMIINGPATANYDIDLGVLPFTDWFYSPIFTVNAASLHARGPPTADNILINGTMTSAYGGQYAVTTLTPGKTHLLRLVNTGINNYIHVGLDGHPFTVVSSDFTPIEPYEATSLVIAVGQRYDVIINATEAVDNYWLRVGTGGGQCDGPNNNAANTRSIFRYAGAKAENPSNSSGVALPTGCYDETNIVPHQKTTVPQQMPEELKVGFTDTAGNGNLVQWLVNGTAMTVDLDHPTLQGVVDGNSSFAASRHVLSVGAKNEWQYWVIQMDNATFSPPLPHPIHLHGHDFYVLDHQENAVWNGDISRLKMDNPIRRDTATLPAAGYLILAFESDNPGAWLMHCHIPFHIAAGLGVQFLERESEIVSSNGDLGPMEQNCASWTKWREEYYPNGILILGDSGL
ncbi:laccase, multicopper oxidase, benzenediol:oxygen oxidorectuctase [Neocucurbitaria cava]|uniref:Laccase, multicopper oxidase, benzenediol:oxygen oxidorectuctase n=1 Tax=Neocucurbitaria cava TaxID=798079 RepID=A0A9W8YEN7_9PLEO|nr:laccase, multicopper oxidase, benzenediol:oxygen oxidorectuctase [Neocucurbitaria cava]